MPRADIDALVMYLLDRYGLDQDSGPMAIFSNQAASERLRTPVAKVKKLRYEAALKFGGDVEIQAKGRLLASLTTAILEPEQERICLIIEDALAKNWLQGKLKEHQQIFDYSFNSEIIKVPADGLFIVLMSLFDEAEIEKFRSGYQKLAGQASAAKRTQLFSDLAKSFAVGAAKAAGNAVLMVLKAHVAPGL